MGPRTSDKIVMGAGLVLFAAVFVPWFRLSTRGADGTHATAALVGMDMAFVWAWLPALLGLAAAVAIAATTLGTRTLPRLPGGWPRVFLVAAAASTVLVVHKLVIGESAHGFGYSVHRSFGIYLATLASVAFVGGSILQLTEERARRP